MKMDRRDFIKKTSVVAGGFFIVPRHVLGKGFTPPSDMLNIAGIGGGGKGEVDITCSWNNGKNNIAAICDVDWNRAKKMMEKFPNAKRYRDYRELLDKEKDIDALTITTPDHTHAVIATAAMSLGKHVYVQKPLTHNIYEARMLTEMAHKQKIVTQMGNQGASSEAVQLFASWFQKGLIGKVHTVHVWTNRPVWPQGVATPKDKPAVPKDMNWDAWIGPAPMVDFHPAYHPFKWRGWWAFGTGALGDMGCHLMDPPYRALGLGYPTEVEASVGQVFTKDWTAEYLPDSCPPSSMVTMKFLKTAKNKSDLTFTWYDGGHKAARHPIIPAGDTIGSESGGVIMVGTKGVMTCGLFGWYGKVYKFNGEKMVMPAAINENWDITKTDFDHQAKWADACKAGFNSKEHLALTSSFDYSGPLTETVIMGNLAIRSLNVRKEKTGGGFDLPGDKKLLWDGANMKITNFEDANQFVKREYREGWKLA
jgi:predicted dehydrogenase